MWKAFFLALGIFLIVLGAETLVVDKFVMSDSRRLPRLVAPDQYNAQYGVFSSASYQSQVARPANRIIQSKDWMPWSLLAAGAITVMYTSSFSRSQRNDG